MNNEQLLNEKGNDNMTNQLDNIQNNIEKTSNEIKEILNSIEKIKTDQINLKRFKVYGNLFERSGNEAVSFFETLKRVILKPNEVEPLNNEIKSLEKDMVILRRDLNETYTELNSIKGAFKGKEKNRAKIEIKDIEDKIALVDHQLAIKKERYNNDNNYLTSVIKSLEEEFVGQEITRKTVLDMIKYVNDILLTKPEDKRKEVDKVLDVKINKNEKELTVLKKRLDVEKYNLNLYNYELYLFKRDNKTEEEIKKQQEQKEKEKKLDDKPEVRVYGLVK